MHRLLPDWSLRQALQAGLLLEVVRPRRVLLAAVAVAVVALAANSSQAVAVPVQQAAGRQQDSSAAAHPDSYHQLPAALVPEAEELVQVKATRTRVNRDR